MGQAFFTLGLGVGSMTIFGSYIDKSRSLTGEALYIVLLDTVVALMRASSSSRPASPSGSTPAPDPASYS